MNCLERCLSFFNQQVKEFSFLDVKLVQFCWAFLAVAVVKLVPQMLQLSIWLFLAAAVVCAAKPAYVFLSKGHGR